MKSLREVVEVMGLRAKVGIVRGRIVRSIVENWYALSLWGTTLERRDGHDVFDQGGSSAPSTSRLQHPSLVVATTMTTFISSEDIVPKRQKIVAKMGRLWQ